MNGSRNWAFWWRGGWLWKRQRFPLLAELLCIPFAAAAPSSLTPAQRKASTWLFIVDTFLRMGENHPVLIVLEDAHWIDATTLEMMMRLTDSIGQGTIAGIGDRAAGFRRRPGRRDRRRPC